MTKAKHTPGPWRVVPDEDIPGHREPDRVKIGLYDYAVGPSANARIIAAAPDMLDALKRLHDWFDTDEELLLSMTGPERFDHERQVAMIRAAIAKATGEAKP